MCCFILSPVSLSLTVSIKVRVVEVNPDGNSLHDVWSDHIEINEKKRERERELGKL